MTAKRTRTDDAGNGLPLTSDSQIEEIAPMPTVKEFTPGIMVTDTSNGKRIWLDSTCISAVFETSFGCRIERGDISSAKPIQVSESIDNVVSMVEKANW